MTHQQQQQQQQQQRPPPRLSSSLAFALPILAIIPLALHLASPERWGLPPLPRPAPSRRDDRAELAHHPAPPPSNHARPPRPGHGQARRLPTARGPPPRTRTRILPRHHRPLQRLAPNALCVFGAPVAARGLAGDPRASQLATTVRQCRSAGLASRAQYPPGQVQGPGE